MPRDCAAEIESAASLDAASRVRARIYVYVYIRTCWNATHWKTSPIPAEAASRTKVRRDETILHFRDGNENGEPARARLYTLGLIHEIRRRPARRSYYNVVIWIRVGVGVKPLIET